MENTSDISVLMIVKNAEKYLDPCLSSVSGWTREIIIVDSGSTDRTLDIAKKYTNKIYQQEWLGFGPQRQLAQSYCSSKWILALDTDEVVSDKLKISIIEAVSEDQSNTVYQINRLTKAFGKFIRHSGWYPDHVVRLYRRKETQYNDALVHEHVVIPAGFKVKKLSGDLLHYTIDSLPQYILKTQKYMEAWTDQREGRKKSSIYSAIAHGLFRFIKMYFLKLGFLDGKHGLLLAILSANVVFTRYADLWIRSQKVEIKK